MRLTKYAIRNSLHLSQDKLSVQVSCPDMGMAIATCNGRYYQIDHTLRVISRITRGVYQHLTQAWKSRGLATY